MKQLDKIIEVIGFPPEEDLGFVSDAKTLAYLHKLPRPANPTLWEELAPKASPHAIDLLRRMLQFSPDKRITVKDAIRHPYFA